MNKNKLFSILLIVAVMAAIVIYFAFVKGGVQFGEKRGVEGDPIDVALGFYEPWLTARQSTSTPPFEPELSSRMELSRDLAAKLMEYKDKLVEGEMDPVLCQIEVPEGLRTIPVYKKDDSAQILVMSSKKGVAGQAVVTLAADDGLWQITDIACGNAETNPNQGEFSFDKEGQLLKNVPAPLDSKYWHLVFEEGGVFGHTAPLFFDGNSVCVDTSGSESVCEDSMFKETEAVHIQGSMNEAGVEVKRVEFRN